MELAIEEMPILHKPSIVLENDQLDSNELLRVSVAKTNRVPVSEPESAIKTASL